MVFACRIGSALQRTSVPSNSSLLRLVRCMSSSKLFVGGMSYATDDSTMKDAFSHYGNVLEARVIIDRDSSRSRGFGFITYASSEEAAAAITAMDGKDLQGRAVRVSYANDRAGGIRRGSEFSSAGYRSGGYGTGAGYDNSTYESSGGQYGGSAEFGNAQYGSSVGRYGGNGGYSARAGGGEYFSMNNSAAPVGYGNGTRYNTAGNCDESSSGNGTSGGSGGYGGNGGYSAGAGGCEYFSMTSNAAPVEYGKGTRYNTAGNCIERSSGNGVSGDTGGYGGNGGYSAGAGGGEYFSMKRNAAPVGYGSGTSYNAAGNYDGSSSVNGVAGGSGGYGCYSGGAGGSEYFSMNSNAAHGGYGSDRGYNAAGNYDGSADGYGDAGSGRYDPPNTYGGGAGAFGSSDGGFSRGNLGVAGGSNGSDFTGNVTRGSGNGNHEAGGFGGRNTTDFGTSQVKYNGQDDLLGADFFNDLEDGHARMKA